MLLIQHDAAARGLLYAGVAFAALGEIAATYAGQARDRAPGTRGRLGLLRSSALEALALRRRDGTEAADRGTKWILVGSVLIGLLVAAAVAAHAPSLRAGANTWPTLLLRLAAVIAGVLLRIWAVRSLGRFFRRDVTIEREQTLYRAGPYRLVRHPAYAGNLISYCGFGLAIGSWVSAGLLLAITAAGHVPRIRVEEAALRRAFGDAYDSYARETARLLPSVW